MSKELKIDENSYLMLLNRVLKNKEEERDLALDRYRKADESIQSNDHFMLLGKNAVSYLRLASDTTNDLANLAKEIKSIVFKESDTGSVSAGQSAEQMRAIIDLAKQSDGEGSPDIDETESPNSTDDTND
jgi:hypothetical protein